MARDVVEPLKIQQYRKDVGHLDNDEAELLEDWEALLAVVEAAKELSDNCDPDNENRSAMIPFFLRLDDSLARLYAGSSGES